MLASESLPVLERLIADARMPLGRLTPAQGLPLVLDFYLNQQAQDAPPEEDGDMLLFQWGTRDRSDTELFELDLTRQFIIGSAEDENIWQLSLTFQFLPTDERRRLRSGSKWCPSPNPGSVDHFDRFVRETAAFQAVAVLEPDAVKLDYFNAG